MSCFAAPDGTDLWLFKTSNRTILWAIADDAVYVTRMKDEEAFQCVQEIAGDGVPVSVRLSKATVIPHKKVMQVCGQEKKLSVEIKYQSLKAVLVTYGVMQESVVVPDLETLQELVESFRRHFGEKAKYKRKEYSPVRALLGPVGVGFFVVLYTWFFASGFGTEKGPNSTRQRAAEQILSKLVEALGPTGVIVIGGLGLAACVFWGYRCVKDPPTTVTVKPK